MHTLKIHGLEMKFKSSLKQGRSGSINADEITRGALLSPR